MLSNRGRPEKSMPSHVGETEYGQASSLSTELRSFYQATMRFATTLLQNESGTLISICRSRHAKPINF